MVSFQKYKKRKKRLLRKGTDLILGVYFEFTLN